jgi:hypothetical protein
MKGIGRTPKALVGGLVIIGIFAFLSSCSSKPEDAIVGRWKMIDGIEIMEFFRDGTVNVVSERGTLGGRYQFIEKARIKVEIVGSVGSIVMKVSISGLKLTITMPDDSTIVYIKQLKPSPSK